MFVCCFIFPAQDLIWEINLLVRIENKHQNNDYDFEWKGLQFSFYFHVIVEYIITIDYYDVSS